MRSTIFVVLATLCLPACGGDDTTEPGPGTTTTLPTGGTGGTGGSGATGGSGGGATGGSGGGGSTSCPDLGAGSWLLENASNTPGTISHDGALAITESGVLAMAFAEPDAVSTSDQDIFVALKTGGSFGTASPLTSDDAVQNAFPSMVADGEELHLVWGGYPDGDNDLFYAHYDGSWSARADLTSSTEGAPTREDYKPSLAIGPGGALAVVYLSSPEDTNNPSEVRVVRIEGGAPVGSPETAILAGADGCDEPRAAFDAAGHLHVVADCGPPFSASIHYATDAGGTWASEVLAGSAIEDNFSPDIAIGPDSATVHVVWNGSISCGPTTCEDIRHVRRGGAGFSDAVDVTTSPGDPEGAPRLSVDRCGRPLVAYTRASAQNFFDVFVTTSDDQGTSFGVEHEVTPNTDDSDEWMLYSSIIHPQSGMPHLSFVRILADSDPLDTEVMHAEFVPTP